MNAPSLPGPDAAPESWALVTAAQAGDREAFGQLYTRYVDGVSRYVHRRVGDHALAEDLTSETFTRALAGLGSLRDQGRDPGAWLTTIARNLVYDHVKSSYARTTEATDEVPEPRAAEWAEAEQPDQQVLDSFEREAIAVTVQRCLDRLSPAQRQAAQLYPYHSVRDTAVRMGRSEIVVKGLRQRALTTMARQLARDGRRSVSDCVEAVAGARAAVDRAHHPGQRNQQARTAGPTEAAIGASSEPANRESRRVTEPVDEFARLSSQARAWQHTTDQTGTGVAGDELVVA